MRDMDGRKKFAIASDGAVMSCAWGTLCVETAREGVMRVRAAHAGKPPTRESAQIASDGRVGGSIEARRDTVVAGGLRLQYREGELKIFGRGGRELVRGSAGDCFWFRRGRSGCRFAMKPESRFYGFGEKAGKLDKRNTRMTMWNIDIYGSGTRREMDPETAHPDPLYASIPFFIESRNGRCHGFFLDTGRRCFFDLGMDDGVTLAFGAEQEDIDLYIIDGPEMADVARRYTELTGRMSMPPLWALGYHQCRWSYETEKRVREIGAEMRRHKVPCDAIWLDIDYMDGFRIFTWDRKRFPRPRQLSADLAKVGIRTVAIVDPGFKADKDWDLYREGVRKKRFFMVGKKPYGGMVWPGDTVFPDFRRREAARWFGRLASDFADAAGLSGIWFDMNEPSDQKDQWANPVHLACGNLFPHFQLRAAAEVWDERHPNGRRFFLTRAAAAGTQRYAAIWTGDNRSRWDHIEMSIPMSCNLGLSGMAFVGSDVGGFAGDCDGELLVRWTQYGAFTPFFRNHACKGHVNQEPWVFGARALRICREYIRLRYRLLPYIYSAFRQAAEEGTPVQRPMIFMFPADRRFINESRQYMLGDHFLAAPVMEKGINRRHVLLPEGRWVNFHTAEVQEGSRSMQTHCPLERMPLFVRAGAPIPMWDGAESTMFVDRSRLRVECYPGGSASTILYEDDGETRNCEKGEYAKIELRATENENERVFVRGATEGKYHFPGRKVEVVFVGCPKPPSRATMRRNKETVGLQLRGRTARGEYSVVVDDCDSGFRVVLTF